jgi:sugar phosphate isomerase/epimerase
MIGRIGVCSWSLQPESPAALAEQLTAIGATGVQLALGPIRSRDWSVAQTRAALNEADITVLSGMMTTEGEDYSTLDTIRDTGGVRPGKHWKTNKNNAEIEAKIASELGLSLVTFHAGFIPHDVSDPERTVLMDRLRTIIDIFADRGVLVGFETGQESADTLEVALNQLERPKAGVNFDPANMILYGMGDPIQAIGTLGPRIIQAHVKDAQPTATPGTWGAEVAAGRGAVDWKRFFGAIAALPQPVDLLVEREAGDTRAADIGTALKLISTHVRGG